MSCRIGKIKTKHDMNKVIKYVVIDKNTKNVLLFKYKIQIAEHLGVSTRTLDRKIPYETENYIVSLVTEIHI